MKLQELAPNAHYDNKPQSIEKDNDGSYLYRYNIEAEMGIPEGETEEKQIGWKCREVRVWEKPSKQLLKKAIIRSVIDETAEFAIINAYNKHVLQIKEDLHAVDRYVEYLLFTEDLEGLLLAEFE